MKAMSKDYSKTLKELNRIFDKHDPVKLGAPSEEYSQEASIILPLLDGLNTIEDVRVALHTIFTKQFDEEAAEFAVNNEDFVSSLLDYAKQFREGSI